jgi:hypothetical protein
MRKIKKKIRSNIYKKNSIKNPRKNPPKIDNPSTFPERHKKNQNCHLKSNFKAHTKIFLLQENLTIKQFAN